jgi:hypothetical protein
VSGEPTPLWRWLVVGLLCTGGTLYVLLTGELPIDKARTMVVNRSSPVYWIFIAAFGAMGVASLFKAWKQIRGA